MDSGGYVVVKDGALVAKGVRRMRGGGKSSIVLSSLTTAEEDSVAVRRTVDKGVAIQEEPRVRDRNSGGWVGYCLVFCALLAVAVWCFRRRFS